MVHLTYIDNPFEKDTFSSISDYAFEQSFYDCINKKFLDDSFKNLEYAFHTYMLTGDHNEWIGYVMFSNEYFLTGLRYHAYNIIKNMINNLNLDAKTIDKLLNMLEESKDKAVVFSTINSIFEILTKYFSMDFVDELKCKYYASLNDVNDYYVNFYVLDVVISLPGDEKIRLRNENKESYLDIDSLAERKYYGFIQETLALVEKEISEKFKNIHIILNREGEYAFLIDSSSFIKKKEIIKKQVINF